MGVDNCIHIPPDFVDLAVNETLESQPAASIIDRAGIEVKLQDVLSGNEGRIRLLETGTETSRVAVEK